MRNTTEVFEDHLAKRLAGKVDEDIQNNYSDEVVFLTGTGAFSGQGGARDSAAQLDNNIPKAKFVYKHTLVKDNYAFLEWTAESANGHIHDGADSFVIENGKIVFQSVHYTVTPK